MLTLPHPIITRALILPQCDTHRSCSQTNALLVNDFHHILCEFDFYHLKCSKL